MGMPMREPDSEPCLGPVKETSAELPSETSIDAVYRRYFPVVHAKCARMLQDPSEAQDIAQETFFRLWENRNSLHSTRGIAAWIYRTSTRLAIDRYRKSIKTQLKDSPQSAPHNINPKQSNHRLEAREILSKLLGVTGKTGKTFDRKTEIAILSRLDGMTHQEIASNLDISERTVRRELRAFDRHQSTVEKKEGTTKL